VILYIKSFTEVTPRFQNSGPQYFLLYKKGTDSENPHNKL
jgi:hypothetical protein